ncbi:hypothetical protein TYRP_006620 [Tyrophagus putrescentiae]|nr:hypothetical protein TYRP_006620 [Tyrophagus putrescentiae]
MDAELTAADLMQERQIFLINRFNLVYNVRKGCQFILKELKGSILDDGFIDITFKTEALKDGTFLSWVTISSINAEFIEWARQEQESMEKALKKTVDYLADLSTFIANFKKLDSKRENSDHFILDSLLQEHRKLLSFKTVELDSKTGLFQSTITLNHLKNFSSTGYGSFYSMKAVGGEAIAYIRRLAQGVTVNFNPSQPLLNISPIPF